MVTSLDVGVECLLVLHSRKAVQYGGRYGTHQQQVCDRSSTRHRQATGSELVSDIDTPSRYAVELQHSWRPQPHHRSGVLVGRRYSSMLEHTATQRQRDRRYHTPILVVAIVW